MQPYTNIVTTNVEAQIAQEKLCKSFTALGVKYTVSHDYNAQEKVTITIKADSFESAFVIVARSLPPLEAASVPITPAKVVKKDPKVARKRRAEVKELIASLNKEDLALYHDLCLLRDRLTKANPGTKNGTVASNQTLVQMALVKPDNLTQLATVKGMEDKTRMTNYGEAFLAAINNTTPNANNNSPKKSIDRRTTLEPDDSASDEESSEKDKARLQLWKPSPQLLAGYRSERITKPKKNCMFARWCAYKGIDGEAFLAEYNAKQDERARKRQAKDEKRKRKERKNNKNKEE
jgi:hypothetical protein